MVFTKEQQLIWNNTYWTCECGVVVKNKNRCNHRKTEKHFKMLERTKNMQKILLGEKEIRQIVKTEVIHIFTNILEMLGK